MNVELITPTVAKVPITHFCSRKSLIFTCNAPAKSKKLNMPCSKASLKSMLLTNFSACSSRENPNSPNISNTSEKDKLNCFNGYHRENANWLKLITLKRFIEQDIADYFLYLDADVVCARVPSTMLHTELVKSVMTSVCIGRKSIFR